ncbi:type II toxin-antitoxin system VapC family toxin [Moraxella marmotae]|uniref:type II toxin-antitoxin system VapC family toxin n=1 Tax=Moraxella marmotae TaxID=3344520 RepID=UPI0035F415CD
MIFQNNVYLDTHAVIWLENGELHKFGQTSLDYLANCHLLISPMVKLELQYLYQKKRISENADTIIQSIANKANFSICQKNWLDIVNVALHCNFTKDAFDRLIVAHAMLDNSILISKDTNLTEHYVNCVW